LDLLRCQLAALLGLAARDTLHVAAADLLPLVAIEILTERVKLLKEFFQLRCGGCTVLTLAILVVPVMALAILMAILGCGLILLVFRLFTFNSKEFSHFALAIRR